MFWLFFYTFSLTLTVDDSDVGEGRRRVEGIKMINLENETESLRDGRRRRRKGKIQRVGNENVASEL